MLRKCKKLLAFLLALALVFTTFSSDYASAKVYAEEDAGQSDNSEGNDSEEENDEEESEDEEEEESDEESEDEESDDEESDEESEEESEEDAESEEIPEEEIPEEEIPEESEEESEESEEGLIVVTYVAKDGGSVSNTKETFDPESEEEIILEGSTATADEGYIFTGWTLGDEKISSEATYVPSVADITENVEFTANFEAVEEEEELAPVKDSVSVNGIKISLHANPGVLPEDAVLDVKTLAESDEVTISEEDVKEAVDAVTTEDVTATYSFDINIYSEEAGGYVQPEPGSSVRITFDVESDEINSAIADEDTDVSVYYIAEDGGGIDGVDKVADIASNEDITINTTHFSIYSVVLKNGNAGNAENNQGFIIKFRDYDSRSTVLKSENHKETVTFTIGNDKITPEEVAEELDVKTITYNGQTYEFYQAVDGGSNNREIDYFFIYKGNNNKYRNCYKVKNTTDNYYLDNGDVYFLYRKADQCTNKLVIAIRNDGVAPSEPNIYGGGAYTYIGPGGVNGDDVDLASYISMTSLDETEVTVDATYNGKKYKVYAVAGIESVKGKLTSTFINKANQYAKDHNKLGNGQYIDWYVIKYQTNDNMWHVDGVVREGTKLNLNYDKNVPAGATYSGLWPDSKQYTADGTGWASAIVEGKNAVERDGKNKFITVTGYTFQGWSTNKNATTAEYVEGNTIPFNKNTTLYAVWKRNTVDVTLTYKYNDGKTNNTVISQFNGRNLRSGDTLTIINNPSREGYTFKGWKSDITGDAKTYGKDTYGWDNTIVMPEKNVILTAQWEANDVKYTVRWIDNDTKADIKTPDTTRTKKAGETAKAEEADTKVTGYKYLPDVSTESVEVNAPDNSSVIKLYFTAHTHNIKYVLDPQSAKPKNYTVPSEENNVKFGTNKTREQAPEIAGYKFEGWTTKDVTVKADGTFVMPDKDVTFTGKFTAQQVKYTVKWFEKDGDTIKPLKNNKGVTEDATRKEYTGKTASAKDSDKIVTGYKYLADDSTESVTVAGDGSSVIALYFTKNNFKVHYRFDGFVPTATEPYNTTDPSKPYADQSYKYQATVNLETVAPVTAAPGYTFSGWKVEESSLTLTGNATVASSFPMPANDVYLVGSFTAKEDTPYIIEYYKQNVNDDNYTIDSAVTENNLTGKTDQVATIVEKSFDGFTLSETKETEYVSRKDGKDITSDNGNKIRGDGTLVIKLYYDRLTYQVTYSYDNTLPLDAVVNPTREVLATKGGTYRYGALVPIEDDAVATGYTFDGWKYSSWKEIETIEDTEVGLFAKLAALISGSKAEQKYFEMPAGNVELIGTFTANTNTKYTVAHYLETAETGKYELGTVEKIGGGIVKNPEEKTGTTATVPTNYVRTIEGYKHNTAAKDDEFFSVVGDVKTKLEKKDAKILADGSLLINVYYQHDAEVVEFYVLKPGLPIPADGLPRDSANYYPYNSKATAAGWVGSAKLASGQSFPVYDTNPDRSANIVEADIISRPTGVINGDETLTSLYPGVTEANIVWYVFKKEGSIAHIDGYIRGQSISVIYNKNDGTETPATYQDDAAKTGEYTLLGEENAGVKALMTREGYTFEGWSLKKDAAPGSADVLQPGSETVVMASGTTFYAVWSVNQYTVKYEYDKVPTGVELPALPFNGEEVSYDYGTPVTIADPVSAPSGYYFTGWKAPETVTVTDGQFNMPAENIVIKGSFAEKLKVTIRLKTNGEDEDRIYNGQIQQANLAIDVDVEGGDDPDLAKYLEDLANSAGGSVLQALNSIRDMIVITSYAYDETLDVTEDEPAEATSGDIVISGYLVSGGSGIDANKDLPGTADEDKKLAGHEKDYPIYFNGSDMTIKKGDVDIRDLADITVVDADGNEITDLSGEITIGYLTIIPRQVTLTSGNGSKVSDGNPLTKPEVAISGDGFVAAVDAEGNEGAEIDVENLEANGAIGTITAPGSVANTIDDLEKFKTDFWRADTNYVITEVLGTLTVTSAGGGGDDTPDNPGTTTIPDAPVALAPSPAVLGAQRDIPVDGPAVLGARRAGTDDSTNRTARAFIILVSAAVALSLVIAGKKKRENEEE